MDLFELQEYILICSLFVLRSVLISVSIGKHRNCILDTKSCHAMP